MAGADSIGLNFFQQSPRCLSPLQAREIVWTVDEICRSSGLKRPLIVGVFVNETADQMAAIVRDCALDAVQLHGSESSSIAKELRQKTAVNARLGVEQKPLKIIRALRLPIKSVLHDDGSQTKETIELGPIACEVAAWEDAGVDAFLFDASSEGVFGGSGKTFDWSLVSRLSPKIAWTLAGGLSPNNVAEAIRVTQAQSVDVASGVETSSGIKDEQLIIRFVKSTDWGSNIAR